MVTRTFQKKFGCIVVILFGKPARLSRSSRLSQTAFKFYHLTYHFLGYVLGCYYGL